jgi:RNA methyltransferase, TrmH family
MSKWHPHGAAHAGFSHPLVRRYLELKRHRHIDGSPAVATEGLWALRASVSANAAVEVVFVCPNLTRGEEATTLLERLCGRGVPVLVVGEKLLRRMVSRDGPDGIAATVALPLLTLNDLRPSAQAVVVVATGVDLVGNLGSLIRCADATTATAVVITDGHHERTHPLVVRSSMSTVFSVPTIEANTTDAIDWLQQHRFRLIAADPCSRRSYRDADYRGRIAIVLGAERTGLPDAWRNAANVLVRIPMRGVADSLNVAVAGALLLYEALHQQER